MSENKKDLKYVLLEELHREKYIEISGGDENAFVPECDLSNVSKEVNNLLETLFCFANGKKPSKTERDIDLNDFTKAVIVIMMSMDGMKRNSFIYRLRHEKYNEITVDQKIDFLRRVYKRLLNLTDVPEQEYLKDYYSYLDIPEDTNYGELYRKDMIELLNEKLCAIADDLYIEEYVKTIVDKVNMIVSCSVNKIFSYNIFGGLLFPKEYSAETINDVFGCLQSKDVFSAPELSLLDYEEKKQLLDILKDKVSDCVGDWEEIVNKVFEGKIEDSSSSIAEILCDTNN